MGLLSRIASSWRRPPKASEQALALARIEQELDRVTTLRRAYENGLRNQRRWTKQEEDWKGIIARQVGVKQRWGPGDPERILSHCESGDMYPLGLFTDFMRTNGTVFGLMSIRTSMLRLPMQWSGDPILIDQLRGVDPTYDPQTKALIDPGISGDFQRMFPMDELSAVMWDGDLTGMGLGEFIPQPDGTHRLRHLDLHWLRYEWGGERWIYASPVETVEIRIPDDPSHRQWFFYTPYGRERPWARAPWLACALPVIAMRAAELDRARWQQDYADPLKAIFLEKDRHDDDSTTAEDFLQNGWKRSPYWVGRTGEDVKLIESSGQGYKVYTECEAAAESAIAKALSGGQKVTSEGTGGWSKGNIFDSIARAVIENSAERLADTIHTQALRPYARKQGRAPLVWVRWDVRAPEQKVAEAEALGKLAESIQKADAMAKPRRQMVDLVSFVEQQGFSLPLVPIGDTSSQADPVLTAGAGGVLDAEYEVVMDEDEPIEFLEYTHQSVG